MNPRQFLLIGGIILVLLGILGLVVLGPTADKSALGAAFYLDNAENVAHLVLGIVALLAYWLLKDDMLVKWLVILVGVIALAVAVIGFLNSGNPAPNVGVSNLENPLDNILHLVVGVWALGASFMGKKTSSGTMAAPPTQM